jgi:cytochrome c553
MKNFSKIMVAVALLALVAGTALAEDAAEKPKEMDGKELFKAHCKACHGVDADAGEYTPMSYIMEQWEEFFDDLWTETHGEIACPQDETKKVTEMLDKDMLKKIKKFCVDHAADSEQPMTCG